MTTETPCPTSNAKKGQENDQDNSSVCFLLSSSSYSPEHEKGSIASKRAGKPSSTAVIGEEKTESNTVTADSSDSSSQLKKLSHERRPTPSQATTTVTHFRTPTSTPPAGTATTLHAGQSGLDSKQNPNIAAGDQREQDQGVNHDSEPPPAQPATGSDDSTNNDTKTEQTPEAGTVDQSTKICTNLRPPVPEAATEKESMISENAPESPISAPGEAVASTSVSMRGLVAMESESKKSWHKEILFGLFLRADKDQLDFLAEAANAGKSLSRSAANCKRKRRSEELSGKRLNFLHASCTRQNGRKTPQPPSQLALIPYFFHRHKMRLLSAEGVNNLSNNTRPNAVVRSSLEEVKKEVLSRFEASAMGRDARSRPILPERYDEEDDDDGSSLYKSRWNATQKAEYAPIALVYNECSISAICKWASRGEVDEKTLKDEEKDRTMGTNLQHRPAAPPFFRLCSVCNRWGHFEIECPDLKGEKMLEVAQEIEVQNTLQGFIKLETTARAQTSEDFDGISDDEDDSQSSHQDDDYVTQSTACEVCGSGFQSETLLVCDGCDRLFHAQCLNPPLKSIPEGDWFCKRCEECNSDVSSVVELDGCEGFVIEQRKAHSNAGTNSGVSLENDISKVSWSTGLGLIQRGDLPSFVHNAGRHAVRHKQFGASCNVGLAVGELCWAKRSNTTKGLPGQNDWWPSTVVNISQRQPSRSGRGQEYTPYTVKMYAVSAGGRIRATAVLPFFQHFKEFGYDRATTASQIRVNSALFRTAIGEAIQEIGCSSLQQALDRARDICRFDENANSVSFEKARLNEMEDVEETEIDGFTVRAKRDASKARNDYEVPRMHSSGIVKQPLLKFLQSSQPPDVGGIYVEWTIDRVSKGAVHSLSKNTSMFGTIIAIDWALGKALVQPLPGLPGMMSSDSSNTDSTTRPAYRSCSTAASRWLSIDRLRVSGETTPGDVRQKFLDYVSLHKNEAFARAAGSQRKFASRNRGKRIKLSSDTTPISDPSVEMGADSSRVSGIVSAASRNVEQRSVDEPDLRNAVGDSISDAQEALLNRDDGISTNEAATAKRAVESISNKMDVKLPATSHDFSSPGSMANGQPPSNGVSKRAEGGSTNEPESRQPVSTIFNEKDSLRKKPGDNHSEKQTTFSPPTQAEALKASKEIVAKFSSTTRESPVARSSMSNEQRPSHGELKAGEALNSQSTSASVASATTNLKEKTETGGQKEQKTLAHSAQKSAKTARKENQRTNEAQGFDTDGTSDRNPRSESTLISRSSRGADLAGRGAFAKDSGIVDKRQESLEARIETGDQGAAVAKSSLDSKAASLNTSDAVQVPKRARETGKQTTIGLNDVAKNCNDPQPSPNSLIGTGDPRMKVGTIILNRGPGSLDGGDRMPKQTTDEAEHDGVTQHINADCESEAHRDMSTRDTSDSRQVFSRPDQKSVKESLEKGSAQLKAKIEDSKVRKTKAATVKQASDSSEKQLARASNQAAGQACVSEGSKNVEMPVGGKIPIRSSSTKGRRNNESKISDDSIESKKVSIKTTGTGEFSIERNKNRSKTRSSDSGKTSQGAAPADSGIVESYPTQQESHNAESKKLKDGIGAKHGLDKDGTERAPKKRKKKRLKKKPSEKTHSDVEDHSHLEQIVDSDTLESELTHQLFGQDVFQAERILNDRVGKKGIEYLIKWKGFPDEESSWEPKENILNENFVTMYEAEKLATTLKSTEEAEVVGSTTYEVAMALDYGITLLASGISEKRNRVCPFCRATFKSISSWGGHMAKHRNETNYKTIKAAGKIAEEDWYKV